MPAAFSRRMGTALTVAVLSIAFLGGCRSRLRGAAPPTDAAPTARSPAQPEDPDPPVRGRIVDELGAPPAATVYVFRSGGREAEEGPVADVLSTVTADANGDFFFRMGPSASGTVRIDV